MHKVRVKIISVSGKTYFNNEVEFIYDPDNDGFTLAKQPLVVRGIPPNTQVFVVYEGINDQQAYGPVCTDGSPLEIRTAPWGASPKELPPYGG